MAKTSRKAGSSRRPADPSEETAASEDGGAIQQPGRAPSPGGTKPSSAPRFRIFIVDCGWNSAARRVLLDNFVLIRELQKDDPIYVLSRERSIEFMRSHGSRIGRDPIIAVHDLAAMNKGGTTGFHGFRLHLGLLGSPQQALTTLQSFARFLITHRQSGDLEAEIRAELRREGLTGAIEIIMHHEAREIGA